MPTTDDQRRLRMADVLDVVEAAAFPATAPDEDAFGMEAEWFAIADSPTGTRRLLRREPGGVDEIVRDATPVDSAVFQTEPGAQLEVATVPTGSVSRALRFVDQAAASLTKSAAGHRACLVAAGLDLWHHRPPPQQATEPRYPAMATFLAARGDAGAIMMRHTASLQLNVDLGRGDVATERWTTSLLAAPLALATFANSPAPDGRMVSQRARTWSAVDPTRTGIPLAFVQHPTWTPAAQLTAAAMAADVMLVRHPDGTATPGAAGWTFAEWIEHGHPVHGWPTADDLRYHLTTLFHEVRPRGWLELRTIDALPLPWRVPAAVLHAGLLLDDRARQRVIEILEPMRMQLPALLTQAAVRGVAEPSLCALAVETWSFALAGARRLADSVDAHDITRTEQFLDRFTLRGRSPADELREAWRRSPDEARDLVTEPVEYVTSAA